MKNKFNNMSNSKSCSFDKNSKSEIESVFENNNKIKSKKSNLNIRSSLKHKSLLSKIERNKLRSNSKISYNHTSTQNNIDYINFIKDKLDSSIDSSSKENSSNEEEDNLIPTSVIRNKNIKVCLKLNNNVNKNYLKEGSNNKAVSLSNLEINDSKKSKKDLSINKNLSALNNNIIKSIFKISYDNTNINNIKKLSNLSYKNINNNNINIGLEKSIKDFKIFNSKNKSYKESDIEFNILNKNQNHISNNNYKDITNAILKKSASYEEDLNNKRQYSLKKSTVWNKLYSKFLNKNCNIKKINLDEINFRIKYTLEDGRDIIDSKDDKISKDLMSKILRFKNERKKQVPNILSNTAEYYLLNKTERNSNVGLYDNNDKNNLPKYKQFLKRKNKNKINIALMTDSFYYMTKSLNNIKKTFNSNKNINHENLKIKSFDSKVIDNKTNNINISGSHISLNNKKKDLAKESKIICNSNYHSTGISKQYINLSSTASKKKELNMFKNSKKISSSNNNNENNKIDNCSINLYLNNNNNNLKNKNLTFFKENQFNDKSNISNLYSTNHFKNIISNKKLNFNNTFSQRFFSKYESVNNNNNKESHDNSYGYYNNFYTNLVQKTILKNKNKLNKKDNEDTSLNNNTKNENLNINNSLSNLKIRIKSNPCFIINEKFNTIKEVPEKQNNIEVLSKEKNCIVKTNNSSILNNNNNLDIHHKYSTSNKTKLNDLNIQNIFNSNSSNNNQKLSCSNNEIIKKNKNNVENSSKFSETEKDDFFINKDKLFNLIENSKNNVKTADFTNKNKNASNTIDNENYINIEDRKLLNDYKFFQFLASSTISSKNKIKKNHLKNVYYIDYDNFKKNNDLRKYFYKVSYSTSIKKESDIGVVGNY